MKTAMIALMASVAMAGTANAAEMINRDGMTGPEVAAWLQKAGYKAALSKDSSGDPMIESAADGTNFKIYFYDCKDDRCKALQFSAGFDLKQPLKLEKANEWNTKNRYLKTYLDEEGDPYVQYDVNVNAGRTLEGLKDDFELWVGMLPDFTTFIGW
ncbi:MULTISPECIES: YbjN domain-containing protein [unclassified Caulobacter]|uniref:YbjN domain-containing protein n=1 Tax=unclassified Caulobacter TaxID=2648921 RepID=UPI000D339984|nr:MULTISPECIES: YbjN domain-containing protein [unclassified Caulobacter]PTS81683.1 YbjN domain-containing protein [Caulobacter sp. HMWF009]PTT06070.1 YbjN domain-containing protein [Caulobacter sp. HMWF025]PTT78506.1 YbjN domain-containing protein [Pseudomonas sp. HMWF010]